MGFPRRILEWAAISFSRGSSQTWNQTHVSCIAGRFFTDWARREAHYLAWDSAIPGLGRLFPFSCQGNFELWSLQIFSQTLSLFFWNIYNANVGEINVVPRSLKLSSFIYVLFSLFCSSAVISSILSSSTFICSSASFTLLPISSNVFLISVVVLFISVFPYIF